MSFLFLVVDCGDPPNSTFAILIQQPANSTTYNSTVEFKCIPGYESLEPMTSTCEANGHWSDLVNNCVGEDHSSITVPYL